MVNCLVKLFRRHCVLEKVLEVELVFFLIFDEWLSEAEMNAILRCSKLHECCELKMHAAVPKYSIGSILSWLTWRYPFQQFVESHLRYFLRGPKTAISNGCVRWELWGGRINNLILFSIQYRINLPVTWLQWPSQIRTLGLPFAFVRVWGSKEPWSHCKPWSFDVQPFVLLVNSHPCGTWTSEVHCVL